MLPEAEKIFSNFPGTYYYLNNEEDCLKSNQLLSINHDILTSFANGLELREVILDISKAFD